MSRILGQSSTSFMTVGATHASRVMRFSIVALLQWLHTRAQALLPVRQGYARAACFAQSTVTMQLHHCISLVAHL